MSKFGSKEWYDERWLSIPEEQRERIVAHLLNELDPKFFDEVRTAHAEDPEHWATKGPNFFHIFGGMAIRNLLRDVLKDDELPEAPYPDGKSFTNWDDYYTQAIEASRRRQVYGDNRNRPWYTDLPMGRRTDTSSGLVAEKVKPQEMMRTPQVVVYVRDDEDGRRLMEWLEARGYRCRREDSVLVQNEDGNYTLERQRA